MSRLAALFGIGAALLEELGEALYPRLCPLCHRPGGAFGCTAHRLPGEGSAREAARCGVCARRLPDCLPDGARCDGCRRTRPRYRRLVVLGDYGRGAALREWVLAFKHGGRRDLAGPLGTALAARFAHEARVRGAPRPRALLVPVPLHPLRRLERGYDQARLLARAVGESLQAPVRSLLVRTRWTAPQGEGGERRANVRGAFRPVLAEPTRLRGVSVWLVDDVVTSGATVDACARALGELGAREVGVLALARAGDSGEWGAARGAHGS